jgi:hypothetical protein
MTDLWSTLMADLSEWGGLTAPSADSPKTREPMPKAEVAMNESGTRATPARLSLVPDLARRAPGAGDNDDAGPVMPVLPLIPPTCAYPQGVASRPGPWILHGAADPNALWWTDEIVIPDFDLTFAGGLSLVGGYDAVPPGIETIEGDNNLLAAGTTQWRRILANVPLDLLRSHPGYTETTDYFDPCYRDVEVTAWSRVESWGTTHRVAEQAQVGQWTLRFRECGRVAAAYPIHSGLLFAA